MSRRPASAAKRSWRSARTDAEDYISSIRYRFIGVGYAAPFCWAQPSKMRCDCKQSSLTRPPQTVSLLSPHGWCWGGQRWQFCFKGGFGCQIGWHMCARSEKEEMPGGRHVVEHRVRCHALEGNGWMPLATVSYGHLLCTLAVSPGSVACLRPMHGGVGVGMGEKPQKARMWSFCLGLYVPQSFTGVGTLQHGLPSIIASTTTHTHTHS